MRKRWSVEVSLKMSYPRLSFWFDVTAIDENTAIEAARRVLFYLWKCDPDAYEYRAIEVEHRRLPVDVPDSHERVYRALLDLHRTVEKFLAQEYVVPVDLITANNEARCALGDS